MNINVCKRPGHLRISRSRNSKQSYRAFFELLLELAIITIYIGNIHRCIHDHFIGGDYNIQLPDCHPESDIEVIDRVTITKPPQYRSQNKA